MTMNTKSRWVIAVLCAVAVALVTYAAGYRMGTQRAIGLCRGTLVSELTALQDIQTNNIPEAVRRIEGHCYAATVILLKSPTWKNNGTVRTFMPELVAYRERHASDQTKWTPTEQRLEELLKREGWKK